MYIEVGPPDTVFETAIMHSFTGDYPRLFKYKVSPTLVAQGVSLRLTGHVLEALPSQWELKE